MADVPYHPKEFRRLKEGELIQAGDVVLGALDEPVFAIGPKHPEIGNPWEYGLMDTLMRKKTPEEMALDKANAEIE